MEDQQWAKLVMELRGAQARKKEKRKKKKKKHLSADGLVRGIAGGPSQN